MTLEELLELWNDEAKRADMTAEELTQLRGLLEDRARELLESGDRNDAVLAEVGQIADTVEAIDGAIGERETAAAEAEQRADDLAKRIFGQDGGEDGEAEGGDGDGDGDDEGDAEETETEEEGEAKEAKPVEAEAEDEREPIAAAAAPAKFNPRITRVNARRPDAVKPRANANANRATLVASANMGGDIGAGEPLDTPEKIGAAFLSAWEHSEGFKNGRQRVSVAKAGGDPLEMYGEDRYLDGNARGNEAKISRLSSPQAITASGGICAPAPVEYDLPIIQGTDARPARDQAMVRYGADRGGVETLPPPKLTDVSGAVGAWTNTTDTTPGGNTKSCLSITCPSPTTDVVDAIYHCMKIGNFRSRFFGEQVQAWLDLGAVWHARFAERRLLTSIGTGSTQVTSGTVLGTARDVLTTLDRAIAQFQSRHRVPEGYKLRFAAPRWLQEMMSTDIARQIPVGTTDETLAVADAQIARWFATRDCNVTWLLDGETGQEYAAQGDGPLNGWASTVVTYLYPEGAWMFLDGGRLDLGIIRDATLTQTNDFEMFFETFEAAHFHGVESLRINMDVCPDGSTSLGIDIAPCAVGS